MTNFFQYDVVVVKFPFASSLKYKARPAVVVSSDLYNANIRKTLLIMAISSKTDTALEFEHHISNWKSSGLLKPSIFKSAIATIEKEYIIAKLGKLSDIDTKNLQTLLHVIC
jgi:mRNA interferase MazF